jgi:hypothetical protein
MEDPFSSNFNSRSDSPPLSEGINKGDIIEEENINAEEAGAPADKSSSSSEELHINSVNSLETAKAYVNQNAHVVAEAFLDLDERCRAKHSDRLYFFEQVCDNINDFKESKAAIARLQASHVSHTIPTPEYEEQLKEACIRRTRSSKQIFEALQEHLTVAAWRHGAAFSRSHLFR